MSIPFQPLSNVTKSLGRPVRLQLLRMRRLPIYKKFAYSIPGNSKLSECLSEMKRYLGHSREAEEYDAHFDGGEWSGPAHARMRERGLDKIAKKHGYKDVFHTLRVATQRTNSRTVDFKLNIHP